MIQKLEILASLALLVGVTWAGAALGADPDLVAWWEFNEGSGGIATDSSGNNVEGTLVSGPEWREDGMHRGCLFFDGAQAHVRVPNQDSLNPGVDSFTFTFWANLETTPGPGGTTNWDLPVAKRDGGSNGYYVGADRNQGTADQTGYRFMLGDTSSNRKDTPYAVVPLGEWVFVAAVLDRDLNDQRISVDGAQTWSNTTPPPGPIAPSVDLGIGWDIGQNNYWTHGRVDDVALFRRALTDEELQQVMLGMPPGLATDPSPADGATDVPRDVVLTWTAGEFARAANGHTVYLSESLDDVTNGIGGINQSAGSYTPAERLEFETTYYWRVDEINAPPDSTVYPGEVWSFETEPLAYPIDGASIGVTASSVNADNMGPENTINGSGLNALDQHSTDGPDMWLSGTGDQDVWIQYEFDKAYKLYEMWVWNSNQLIESFVGLGVKDVTIEVSTDGAVWTPLENVPQFAQAPGAPTYTPNTTVDFGGVVAKYVKLSVNSGWGPTGQYGLSEVRFFYIPLRAREPYPALGQTAAPVDATLTWRAGREAAEQEVHLSTDEQAVINANALVSTVTEPAYEPMSLDLDQTYYWRIDGVNTLETPSMLPGNVWHFTTQEYLVVDDFEDYDDDCNRIFFVWQDGLGHKGGTDVPDCDVAPYNGNGTGSIVGNETSPFAAQVFIHTGRQAMPLFYSNTNGAATSETKRSFVTPQNWAQHGIKTLTVWFRGVAGNTGSLYVKINNTKVSYDGDAVDIQLGWQAWNIDLSALNLNLESVTSLSIGIDGAGAEGVLLIDDIRLYPHDQQFITPTEPSDAGLIGYWKLDGDAQDASGLGNHGTAVGDPIYEAGLAGQALVFDGIDDYLVIDPVADDITNNDITLSAWLKTADTGTWQWWFSCNTASGGNVFLLGLISGQVVMYEISAAEGYSNTRINNSEWHHVAYTRLGDLGSLYVDGVLEGTHDAGFNFSANDLWSIGQEWDNTNPSDFLTGSVDDVRIYDRGLSYAEIAGLAGRTMPFDKPFED